MKLEQANQLIEEINSIDLEKPEGQEVLNSIIKNKIIQSIGFKITFNPHPELFYVRARIIKNQDDYFETVDDYSYNKKYPEYINRGRTNFEKQPIFYAGRTRATSLSEVNIIQNKQDEENIAYGVSRWIIKKPMNFITILNPDTMSEINCGELTGFLDFVQKQYTNFKESDQEGLVIFYKYLSEKFTELIVKGDEHKYIFTSTFANLIFENQSDIAGLLYQSVKWPDSYNLAIKPEFIDEGYMVPSHFFKQTFKRKNIDELTEIKMEQAESFDLSENKVNW